MNERDQQIAIAEACGWRKCTTGDRCWIRPDGSHTHTASGKDPLPDYLHDLNAMHEAEKILPPRHEQYALELASILECNQEGELNDWDCWKVAHATAAQRAEAFLRTIGKRHDPLAAPSSPTT